MVSVLRSDRLRAVILIAFLLQGYDLAVTGFVAKYLLSAYDTSVLPYFNFFSSVMICLVFFGSYWLIRRLGSRSSRYIVLAHLVMVPILYAFSFSTLKWATFVVCTLLNSTGTSFYVVFVANAARFLNIRESRQFGGYVIAVYGVASLVFTVAIWFLVRSLSSNVLLVLAELACVLMYIFGRSIFTRDFVDVDPPFTGRMIRPKFYYPFLVYTLTLRIIVAVIISYLFLVYLKTNYQGDSLAIVSTLYTCLFSVLVVLFQLLLQERFFNWLGIAGVLVVFPVFIVIISTLSLFLTTVPVIVVITLITSVIALPLFAARETLISSAARSLHLRLRTNIMTAEHIVGEALIGTGILMLLGQGEHATRNLTLAIIVLGCVALLFAWFINRGFREVLRAQVEQPRYLFFQASVAQGDLGPITTDVAADAKRIALKVLKRGVVEPMRGNVLNALKVESHRTILYYNAFQTEQREHVKLELKARHARSLERFLYLFAALNTDTRGVLNSIPKITEQVFAKWNDSQRAQAIEYLDAISDNAVLRSLLKETLEVRHTSIKSELNDPWITRVQTMAAFEPREGMSIDERVLFLRRVNLFEGISAEGLEAIAGKLKVHAAKPGEAIFQQGEQANSVCMVVKGSVAIVVGQTKQREIGPYGQFGELAFLDNQLRSASAFAQTDVVLLELERAEFQHMIDNVPELAKAIIRQLMAYLRKTERYGT